jgi:hypothetical protein
VLDTTTLLLVFGVLTALLPAVDDGKWIGSAWMRVLVAGAGIVLVAGAVALAMISAVAAPGLTPS